MEASNYLTKAEFTTSSEPVPSKNCSTYMSNVTWQVASYIGITLYEIVKAIIELMIAPFQLIYDSFSSQSTPASQPIVPIDLMPAFKDLFTFTKLNDKCIEYADDPIQFPYQFAWIRSQLEPDFEKFNRTPEIDEFFTSLELMTMDREITPCEEIQKTYDLIEKLLRIYVVMKANGFTKESIQFIPKAIYHLQDIIHDLQNTAFAGLFLEIQEEKLTHNLEKELSQIPGFLDPVGKTSRSLTKDQFLQLIAIDSSDAYDVMFIQDMPLDQLSSQIDIHFRKERSIATPSFTNAQFRDYILARFQI